MDITLNDPIQKKSETRTANANVASCKSDMFGVPSALGDRVDIFSGTNFFDTNKRLMQRIRLKSPYVRCSMWIDGNHVKCLGVKI